MKEDSPINKESIYRWDYILAFVLLAAMALITFVNVLSRYIFHFSFSFTEEITKYLFVYLVIIGAGIAFERGGHMGMVSLYNVLPKSCRKWICYTNAFLCASLFLVVIFTLGQTVYQEITLLKSVSSLGVYYWIYYAIAVLLTPCLFIGVYRGTKTRCQQLDKDSEEG